MDRPSLRSRLLRLVALVLTGLVLGAVAPAGAQLALPIQATGVRIQPGTTLKQTLDLGTIPNRPDLHIDVVPTNPLVELEIEVSGWAGLGGCVGQGGDPWIGSDPTYVSAPTVGAASLVVPLRSCEPRVPTGFWDDGTVDVTIGVLNWSAGFPSVEVDIRVRGVTVIPTGERLDEVDTTPVPTSLAFFGDRDTVLYASNLAASNGNGDYLWAGHDYRLVGQPPIQLPIRSRLNSLIAFRDFLQDLPIGSVVTNASVELFATSVLGGGGTVRLFDVSPSSSGEAWLEGSANASGSELVGAVSSTPAADWNDRRGDEDPWTTAGGDLVTPSLAAQSIGTTGSYVFYGAALEASIQDAVDARTPHEGFLLRGPATSPLATDVAVQFASRTNPSFGERPRMVIDFTPPANAGGTLTTGTVTYIGEGQNFRWIYDTDGDDLLYTSIGGVCEALDQEFPDGTVAPYNYSYQGSPGYVGTDCCAWYVDAPNTGVVGTGQAIFFHNLDPTNPANLPPDTDGDGMRDGCDNCVDVPNGPFLGTCVGLDGPGGLCTADTDCGQYEYCSQSQEDVDLDETGDACSVPEPGFGVMLGVSVVWLGAVLRGRRGRRGRAGESGRARASV